MKANGAIREDLIRLQNSINECLDDLAIARDKKDDGDEQIALRRMESLLEDVKQTCISVLFSLQEEPVSEELKVELEKYIKDHFTIDTEQLDRFSIEEKDYMYSMDKSDMLALVEHFTNWQKTKEEPLSEELEYASKEWLIPQLDKSYDNYGEAKMMELTHFDGYAMLDAIEFGAKWKEEQFEKERLKHCEALTDEQAKIESDFVTQHLKENNRPLTCIDAIEYGMKLQKEQMMKDATEAYIRRNRYTKQNVLNGFDVTCDAIQKFNGGDKVKVLILK